MNKFKNLRTAFWSKSIISAAILFSLCALFGHFAAVNGQQRKERCENNKRDIAGYKRQKLDLKLIAHTITNEQAVRDTYSKLNQAIANGRLLDSVRDKEYRKRQAKGANLEWNSQWETDHMAFQKAWRDKAQQTLDKARQYSSVEKVQVDIDKIEQQIKFHENQLEELKCYTTPAANIEGIWIVRQGSYTGVLRLYQSGTNLSGSMDWDNHADATIESGSYIDGKMQFVLSYSNGSKGTYTAQIDESGISTINGAARSSTGSTVTWSGTKQ